MLSFLKKDGAKELSADLRKALGTHNFGLDKAEMARLRYVSKSGIMGRSRVQSVRIFDPSLLVKDGGSIGKYDDLDQMKTAIVVEGYIQSGTPYLYRR